MRLRFGVRAASPLAISKISELKMMLRGVKIENPQILAELQTVLEKATSNRFSQTFVKKQLKSGPITQNRAEKPVETREDPSTFLERLRHAEALEELPDRAKVSWPNG
jgi:hypothetical protein